jgi:hypothetical protein
MTNPGQVTLESLQAELPEGDFQLFIMPQKVKSGYSDSELVDEHDEDAIDWDDEDWSEEDPESGNFIFRTRKDLAIARYKRAIALFEKSIQELVGQNGPKGKPGNPQMNLTKSDRRDPILDSLREEALKLQRSLGMFD